MEDSRQDWGRKYHNKKTGKLETIGILATKICPPPSPLPGLASRTLITRPKAFSQEFGRIFSGKSDSPRRKTLNLFTSEISVSPVTSSYSENYGWQIPLMCLELLIGFLESSPKYEEIIKDTRNLKKSSIMKDIDQIKQIEKSNLEDTDSAGREKYFRRICHFKEQKKNYPN